jgi:hypothetical protein
MIPVDVLLLFAAGFAFGMLVWWCFRALDTLKS